MALLAHTLKPFHPRVCLIAPPYAIVGGTLTARIAQDSDPLGMKGGV